MRIGPSLTPPLRALAVAVPLAIGILAPAPVDADGPTVIDLGRASSYAVLAGAGVVDTGPSLIHGDVGSQPMPLVSDILDREVVGEVQRAGFLAAGAQEDLAAAYDAAANAVPTDVLVNGSLDGLTLPAGVYAAGRAKASLSGTLVLDGANQPGATWIFVLPAGLATAPDSRVTLTNGAKSCNVFWQVAGATTLGNGTSFVGTILATKPVVVERGVTIDGRILARDAGVALAGVGIDAPSCASSAQPQATPILPSPPAVALAGAPPPTGGPRPSPRSSMLPLIALALVIAAVVLGEPRRPRPARRHRDWQAAPHGPR